MPSVRAAAKELQRKYKGQKIIAGVDRLDITKGFVERLIAYRDFLRQYPREHGKIVFVLVGAPSRGEIAAYQKLSAKVDGLVEQINDEFGTAKWLPVDYNNQGLNFEEVTALFQIADVAFIAPLRDGMNLVAKEYIASKKKDGVLILSDTAGADRNYRTPCWSAIKNRLPWWRRWTRLSTCAGAKFAVVSGA